MTLRIYQLQLELEHTARTKLSSEPGKICFCWIVAQFRFFFCIKEVEVPDGMMGYQTPNIDRVAKAGITFTDYYAE